MDLPRQLELHTGADRYFRRAVALVWMGAAFTLILHGVELRWWSIAAGVILLLVLNPRRVKDFHPSETIKLNCDGTVAWSRGRARWCGHVWFNRWFILLGIEDNTATHSVLICRSRNSQDDYRHLLIWNRFPPFKSRKVLADAMLPP